VNPASRRKVVLPRVTRQILERQGYKFGNKIRVPGGYAYEVTDPKGNPLRLGLKTAVNRWLNTATTLVKMVDTVIVSTFEWNVENEKPEKFELIEISSGDLLKMIGKVRDEAGRRGEDPDGHHYIPLDDRSVDTQTGSVAGSVLAKARIIFGPEAVVWVDEEWGRVDSSKPGEDAGAPSSAAAAPVDVTAMVADTKNKLAARLGISPDRIDLTIRF
jgi:hypothetical protein